MKNINENCSLKSVTPASGESLLKVLFMQVHQPVHSSLPILAVFLLGFFSAQKSPLVRVRDSAAHSTSRLLTVDSVDGHRHKLRRKHTLWLLISLELSWVDEGCPAHATLVTISGGFNGLRRSWVSSDVIVGHIYFLLKLSTLLYIGCCRLFIHHVPW